MRRTMRLTSVGIVFLGLFLSASVEAGEPHTVQMAQGSKDLLIKEHQYYKQPIVETGWKMTAQQAVLATIPERRAV